MASTTLTRSATTGAGAIGRAATGLTLGSLTYAGWFRVGAVVGSYNTLAYLNSSTGNTVSWVGYQSDGVLYAFNGSAFASLGAVATGDWLYVAVSQSGTTTTTRVTRNNSTTATTVTQALAAGAVPALIQTLGAGADGSVDNSAASVNLVRVWSAALTAAEIAAEQASYSPVKTAGLWSAATLADTTTGLNDTSGNARPWTATGSLTAGTANPYLTASPPFSAAALSQASVSATLTTSIALAAAAVASSTATGNLTTAIRLSAAAQAVSTVTATLVPAGFAAAAVSQATLSSSLTTQIALSAAAQASATASGSLSTQIALSAALVSQAAATAAINLIDYYPALLVFKPPLRARTFAVPARYPTFRSPART